MPGNNPTKLLYPSRNPKIRGVNKTRHPGAIIYFKLAFVDRPDQKSNGNKKSQQ
jgi:hypothetical protein